MLNRLVLDMGQGAGCSTSIIPGTSIVQGRRAVFCAACIVPLRHGLLGCAALVAAIGAAAVWCAQSALAQCGVAATTVTAPARRPTTPRQWPNDRITRSAPRRGDRHGQRRRPGNGLAITNLQSAGRKRGHQLTNNGAIAVPRA